VWEEYDGGTRRSAGPHQATDGEGPTADRTYEAWRAKPSMVFPATVALTALGSLSQPRPVRSASNMPEPRKTNAFYGVGHWLAVRDLIQPRCYTPLVHGRFQFTCQEGSAHGPWSLTARIM